MSRIFVSAAGACSAAGSLGGLVAAVAEGRRCLRPWRGEGLPELRCGVVPDLDRTRPAEALLRAALADAALPPLPPETGLIYATTTGGIAGAWERARATGEAPPPGASRQGPGEALYAQLGLRGPLACLSVACASGTAALGLGQHWLRAGRAPAVLVLASDALSPFLAAGFRGLGALSPRGLAEPFRDTRDGLTLGEAGVALLLERDPGPRAPMAELRGWGLQSDAGDLVRPDPSGAGLARAAERALAAAGWGPEDVDLVSAHGTATRANDDMERAALGRVFGRVPPLRAIKGLVGHAMGAAGALEIALEVAAMAQGLALPALDLEGNPLPSSSVPTRVLKLSAGFGGVNTALALSRPGREPAAELRREPLLQLAERALHAEVRLEERPDTWERAVRALVQELVQATRSAPPAASDDETALILCTRWGCLLADRRYHDRLRAEGPDRVSRQDFARTLPGAALVGAQIAAGLRGPALTLLADPEEGERLAREGLGLGSARALLLDGDVEEGRVCLRARLFGR